MGLMICLILHNINVRSQVEKFHGYILRKPFWFLWSMTWLLISQTHSTQIRYSGADREVPPRHDCRQEDRCLGNDGAFCRQRLAGSPHLRQTRRRRLDHQRQQSLHHQWPPLRRLHRRRCHESQRKDAFVLNCMFIETTRVLTIDVRIRPLTSWQDNFFKVAFYLEISTCKARIHNRSSSPN